MFEKEIHIYAFGDKLAIITISERGIHIIIFINDIFMSRLSIFVFNSAYFNLLCVYR